MSFDLDIYLDRIGLSAPPDQSARGLAELQGAQLRAISFECIDAFLGRVPDVSAEGLWRKLVVSRRGGYCFEINSLFGQALAALGFSARPVMARVRSPALPRGGARSHLAWIVRINGEEWLADAGFGGPCPPEPIRFGDIGIAERDGAFRLVRDGAEEIVERRSGGQWTALYGFDRAEVTPFDIEAANFVCARWERAPFPNNLILAIQTGQGRASLLNRAMRIDGGGATEKGFVGSKAELAALLSDPFRLKIAADMVDAIWSRLLEVEVEPHTDD